MPAGPFLSRLGFTDDPFEFTNADDEPQLTDYFVPPPYFLTIFGDPEHPRSHVVLAPRGGGKSAQRRMIEARADAHGKILCVTYERFDQPSGLNLGSVTHAYHMNQLSRLVLVGILVAINANTQLVNRLTSQQKRILKASIARFLGQLSTQQFNDAVSALKSFGDKASAFWRKYGGPVAVGINVILKRFGIDKIELPPQMLEEARRDDSLSYYFGELVQIVRTIGFDSTYILVDKVDELQLTADATSAYQFIRPLLLDLPTLETSGVAFKLFLWEEIEKKFTKEGRTDRVPVEHLSWTVRDLEKMLSRRLEVYSAGQVRSFNRLLCDDSTVDVHRLVAHIANGSPRDMIRLAQRIVAEETRTVRNPKCLSETSIWAGVQKFSVLRSTELFQDAVAEVARIDAPTFTLNHLANDLLHVSHEAARQRVRNWERTGIIRQVGTIPNKGQRPLKLFALADVRVMIAIAPEADVSDLLRTNALVCPDCGGLCVTDRDPAHCPGCGHQVDRRRGKSLREECTLKS